MRKGLKIIFSILMVSILLLCCVGCSAKLPKEKTLERVLEDKNYKLIFEDEFEGDALNEKIWINGYPVKDRGAAYYVEDAVKVKDGELTITTNFREDGEYGEGWYTGWIESADSTSRIIHSKDPNITGNPHIKEGFKGFYTKYGYFEARCKVPKIVGSWSAFWLMPCYGGGMTWDEDEIGTARDGVEIDVMESFNYGKLFSQNCTTHVIHMDSYGKDWKTVKSDLTNLGSDIYDEYHTYGVMWTPEEYIFYLDGKESWRTDCGEYGVSHSLECILLTSEVPGSDIDHPGKMLDSKTGKYKTHWSGDVNKNKKNKDYDFVIDYVRVYQN